MSTQPTFILESTDLDTRVGPGALRRLTEAWPRRATVRGDLSWLTPAGDYDPRLPDYPTRLLPFAEHPLFTEAPERQRLRVGTLAWLFYNERVIEVEEAVVNPTFEMLARGRFPGLGGHEVREAAKQAQVDEVWHTYLHMLALHRSREARMVEAEPDYANSVTARRLREFQAAASESWERDLLALLWTTVAEVSVSAYLELLAADGTVQAVNSLVCRMHSRDESAHGPVMHELVKRSFASMSAEQKNAFVRFLPEAVKAFGAEDFDLWPDILRTAGIERAREIVEDCRGRPEAEYLVTDYSGVQRLLDDLGIADRIDFEFPVARPAGV